MEIEQLEPRVGPLAFKVKAASRESSSTQKAAHLLDPDLRSHWATGTNTKEWIILELEEPCLLSHIRIYNKSVFEWEISVGLQFKPEAFVKVRPRCEAPRRDMIYPTNYTVCRYVRVSCLRGNPISIYFVQLIGVSVSGLEPEFQPLVNHLLPHIISHKQDSQDVHLKLLRDITSRLSVFLPYLETDLSNFTEEPESRMRFLSMLAGPYHPLLQIVKEREAARTRSPEAEVKINQTPVITVSSNFEVQSRRPRNLTTNSQPALCSIVFRPDVVFMLLRKAFKDQHLGFVCQLASLSLRKLMLPTSSEESAASMQHDKMEKTSVLCLSDYSIILGDEFLVPDEHWDISLTSLLDISSVEEGIFHMLYACAAQPLLCGKLTESRVDFLSILPLVQALLPALRPPLGTLQDLISDDFSQWGHPLVHRALSQIVAMSSSTYYPLLRASAGYLSSFSASQAKAACIMIDLCSGVLSHWLPMVVAKVDLAVELIEDLLLVIQGVAPHSTAHPRIALKYIALALSGHVDDVLAKYTEVKHNVLFLIEMLECFLDPVISVMEATIAFKGSSKTFMEKQEESCEMALNIIHTAVQKPAVLPHLEREWRRGSVPSSVLLSVLGPNMPLPPEIDMRKSSASMATEMEPPPSFYDDVHEITTKLTNLGEAVDNISLLEVSMKIDMLDDANLLFAPAELKNATLVNTSGLIKDDDLCSRSNTIHHDQEDKPENDKMSCRQLRDDFIFDDDFSSQYLNLKANYLRLVNYEDCESRASQFRQLALDLHSEVEISPEGHAAAIDALLLAAECYLNPFSMCSVSKLLRNLYDTSVKDLKKNKDMEPKRFFGKSCLDPETIVSLESRRDKTVLEILLLAAELDCDYDRKMSQNSEPRYNTRFLERSNISSIDMQHADSITIVRQNQSLLCQFVMRYLKRDELKANEVLLQSLLFFLQSATELCCVPEDVIDVILRSAEHLNGEIASYHCHLKGGTMKVNPSKLHHIQRHCLLLQKLVIVSLGVDDDNISSAGTSKNGFQCRSLVPPKYWMQKIPVFSKSPPLARFMGWMAISLSAKMYLREQLFLTSDISQLTSLLSIFGDDLALAEQVSRLEQTDRDIGHPNRLNGQHSFQILYPEIYRFFPMMKKQYMSFGETILQAVCQRLRSLPSAAISGILCWFSDLCTLSFLEFEKEQVSPIASCHRSSSLAATNAKRVILFVLKAVVREHMEAMVPEMPRVAKVLMSLCRSSYSDVNFLNTVSALLKPLISYALRKVSQDEPVFTDDLSSNDFESICFGEIFSFIKSKSKEKDFTTVKGLYSGSQVIFTLGVLYPDLSFKRKNEILLSLAEWTDFTTLQPTTYFLDYLLAFQCVMNNCTVSLAHALEHLGISIPFEYDEGETEKNFGVELLDSAPGSSHLALKPLSLAEVEELSKTIKGLIRKLFPTVETSWALHSKLSRKLTKTITKSILLMRCLSFVSAIKDQDVLDARQSSSGEFFSNSWVVSVVGLSEDILKSQQNHHWQVTSCMLDYVLGLSLKFSDTSIAHLCSIIMGFSCLAPRISWRLQADKWLQSLFSRDIGNLSAHNHLVDMFSSMLSHWEPEQRYIALKHLGRLIGLNFSDGVPKSPAGQLSAITYIPVKSAPDSVMLKVVSGLWDRVASVASSDPSMRLRAHAMTLLSGFVPYAEQRTLRSFLVGAHTLPGLAKHSYMAHDVDFTQLSVALLTNICLFSSFDYVSLISDDVWQRLEYVMTSKAEFGDVEKSMCEALCQLRTDFDHAKEVLKVLSSSSNSKQGDPSFNGVRESILQVISSLTSVQAHFDFFSEQVENEAQELDEAEIELELLQKEQALQKTEGSERDVLFTDVSDDSKDGSRLQQIKAEIRSLEKSKLKEEIIARRQRKLLLRQGRQKYLEEAALREMELLQELDRERSREAEREIERQRVLEVERAKTRELQYNLDLERERQVQHDLQKELELVESGVPSSRKDLSNQSRRMINEVSLRGRDGGTSQMPLAGGSRASSFMVQPPTILQAIDRVEEGGLPYEENYEGGRDSGDAGSIGDPETASSLEAGGFAAALRQGRSGKGRPIVERREREGRREGKWERKHS